MKRPQWLTQLLAHQTSTRLLLFALLFSTALTLVLVSSLAIWQPLFAPLNQWILGLEFGYQQWVEAQRVNHPLVLLPLAYIGGLIASISPCILSLLPVNLSYIGTREFTSRWDALVKAGSFVAGVVTVLCVLGLFSSLASLVMVQYQGYVHLAVGLLILLMGFSLLGVLQIPLPSFKLPQPQTKFAAILPKLPSDITGAYGVGLTFALLSSPCTSPMLFAFLGAAAATGSQIQSVLIMVTYALGYTTVIFLASLFTGLVKQARGLLQYSEAISACSSLALIVLGGFYLINGCRWILALLGQA